MADTKMTARPLWLALAAVDAVLLAYLASQFDWLTFDDPHVGPTPAGWIIVLVVYVIEAAGKLLAVTFVAAVGAAIVLDFRGGSRPHRLLAALLSLPLLATLCLLAWLAIAALTPALAGNNAAFLDRLIVFDRLAKGHAEGVSIAGYVVLLCGAMYLAEKYLLRWWGVRWPVPLVALAVLAWPLWVALDGERAQRDWMAAQEWRAVNARQTWLEALAACGAQGAGWRLPQREELSLYLATRPAATAAWRGAAWTQTAADYGRWGIVVGLEPRLKGYWRSNDHPWRDRSVCERDANPPTRNRATDWFAGLQPRVCADPEGSPALHPSAAQFLAAYRGMQEGSPPRIFADQTSAAVICVRPAPPETRLPRRGRGYPEERLFTGPATFQAYMDGICGEAPPRGDATACGAFAPRAPAAAPPAAPALGPLRPAP